MDGLKRPHRGSWHWVLYVELVNALKLFDGDKNKRSLAFALVTDRHNATRGEVKRVYHKYIVPMFSSGMTTRELF